MDSSRVKAPLAALFAGVTSALLAFTFDVTVDRANAVYSCGEKATFRVTATETNGLVRAGSAEVTLDWCGGKKVLTRTVDLSKENPFVVTGTLDEPGFLRLRATGKDAKTRVFGVAFSPLEIKRVTKRPADFDAFWEDSRARLAKEVPPDFRLTRIPERSTADFEFYRISAASFGRRVHGYLSVPTDRTKAPYPLRIEVPGAGNGGWANNMGGDKNAVRLFMSVFPFEPNWDLSKVNQPHAEMQKAFKEKYGAPGYAHAGFAASREEQFYYPVILGVDRVIDWVASRPDVDRARVGYFGTSQGGAFGCILMGFNRSIRYGVAYVPAMCDMMAIEGGRRSGWPRPVEDGGKTVDAVRAVAPYFDAANFAERIKIPVRIVVGFADDVCPPWTGYAAFNVMPSKDKQISHGIGMGHSVSGELYGKMHGWVVSREKGGSNR